MVMMSWNLRWLAIWVRPSMVASFSISVYMRALVRAVVTLAMMVLSSCSSDWEYTPPRLDSRPITAHTDWRSSWMGAMRVAWGLAAAGPYRSNRTKRCSTRNARLSTQRRAQGHLHDRI